MGMLLPLLASPRPGEAQDTTQTDSLPPVGMGRLLQEDISVGIDDGTVQFRIMPLDESIIRLLAPDSYTSPHSLREMRHAEIQQAAERRGVTEPVVFFVTVFGMRDQAHFDPDQVVVASRNRLFRPFENGLAMWEPFTVEYAGARSDDWGRSLVLIERERARIGQQRRAPR
jgi:hypothetical protein